MKDGFDLDLHREAKQAFNRFIKGASIHVRSDIARICADYSQLNDYYEAAQDRGDAGGLREGVERPEEA